MTLSAIDLEFVSRLVRERSAIVLDAGKGYLVESRLAPVARAAGLGSVERLVRRLRAGGAVSLQESVVEAMTTNETFFFRDHHPFELLRTTIVPALMQLHATSRSLTMWSAACSSGQEVYSIAMLLREHFPQLATWRVRLLATDLSRDMVRRTREGVYTQLEVNRGLPAPLLVKYLKPVGTSWQVRADLRAMVETREMNLAAPWPAFPGIDVVLMRNVLIYFDPATKQKILHNVSSLLRPGGALLLGAAESTVGMTSAFQRVQEGKAGYYRKPEAPAGVSPVRATARA